jgi:cell division septation protein DedD
VAAPAGAGRFAVQLGVRGSEQEARAAFAQYVAKYPELSGHAPAIARAEVAGKTVYRVRVGNLSREDANTLCNGLKSSGGQCFVAQN